MKLFEDKTSVIDRIYTELTTQNLKSNPLIGAFSTSGARPEQVIEGPYVRANNIFPRARHLIESAKSEVLICLYKFQNSSDGAQEIIEGIKKLKAKAEATKQRITVRIIINQKTGLATYVSGDSRNSPIDINSLYALSSEYFDIQIAQHTHKMFDSSHSKMIVCDGNKGMVLTGDPTFKNDMKEEENWIEAATVYQDISIGRSMRQQFLSLWNKDNVVIHAEKPVKKTLMVESPIIIADKDQKTILHLGKKPSASPAINFNSPYKIALLNLLKNAKNSVNIMVNNINDTEILDALLSCAARGITVNVVVGRYHGESAEKLPFAGGTNLQSMEYLLKNASEEQRKFLNLRWACNKDNLLVQNMAADTIHAKIVVVDDFWVLTGSSLMDRQSSRSGETDILFESKALAHKYNTLAFNPVFNKGRPVYTSTEMQSPTREKIEILLNAAHSIADIKNVLKLYINMREYEDNHNAMRSLLSLFRTQNHFKRDNKISTARNFLDMLNGKPAKMHLITLGDGLLGKIYGKYLEIDKMLHSSKEKSFSFKPS